MTLSVQIAGRNSAMILTLSGRVTTKDTAELRKNIEQLINSNAVIKAIDLTDIEYIDSYALGQIIYYCNNADGGRGAVYVLNRTRGNKSYIDKLIDISDLKQVFSIVDSLDGIAPAAPPTGA
ncbi:MAG: STAS domain-containing protein [Chitinispirillaceae bacterium]|nr:STAS domain-containing protein [Chitinispirillaceae bacterium]